MEQNNQKSILQMAQGAFEERVDYEMSRVIDNIMDINTDPTAKRKITLTITLTPDKARRIIKVNVTATSKLAPTDPVETSLLSQTTQMAKWYSPRMCRKSRTNQHGWRRTGCAQITKTCTGIRGTNNAGRND